MGNKKYDGNKNEGWEKNRDNEDIAGSGKEYEDTAKSSNENKNTAGSGNENKDTAGSNNENEDMGGSSNKNKDTAGSNNKNENNARKGDKNTGRTNLVINILTVMVFLLLVLYFVSYFVKGGIFSRKDVATLQNKEETELQQSLDEDSSEGGSAGINTKDKNGKDGTEDTDKNSALPGNSKELSKDEETGTKTEDTQANSSENSLEGQGENSGEDTVDSTKDERMPVKVKGIYVSGPMAGTKSSMEKLIDLVDTTELNAMVIDIKNDSGEVTYDMDLPIVQEIGSDVHYIHDIKALVSKLKEKHIYLIARIVAFKDPLLAKKKPSLSIKNKDGSIFRDSKGLSWVNPYKKEVWDYLVSIGKEAADLGFDEIQFDYIRFSTDSAMKNADFGKEAETKTKEQVIMEFTKYACEQLKPLGVFVSADVYGTIIDSKTDAAIVGQDYAGMSEYLDYISPMIYPSHYADGVYGISHPDLEPYNLIKTALEKSQAALEIQKGGTKGSGTQGNETKESGEPKDGTQSSKETSEEAFANNSLETAAGTSEETPTGASENTTAGTSTADVRPWLQDFTATWIPYHKTYGAKEIRAQIQAVYDAGYDQWILWNGRNQYTKDGLLKE